MPPEKACVAIRCLVDELMVQCPFPRCEKQGQRQWMSQKHIHVCLCKPSTPFLIRRCTCVSQTNKLESLEKLVLQLQQSQVEFSERLDTLSSSISTHVYPKLSSLESDLSTIRCTLEADSNFKMDTAQKCSSIQAELLALRRRSDAFLESTTRGFKMLGLRPARVEKL
ncbi:hypothetical protein HMI55_001991 [Coelomomyces lativittatus]|nr:hypothetical protein HMI55_001991 [Coelomomyces lativittatus]